MSAIMLRPDANDDFIYDVTVVDAACSIAIVRTEVSFVRFIYIFHYNVVHFCMLYIYVWVSCLDNALIIIDLIIIISLTIIIIIIT